MHARPWSSMALSGLLVCACGGGGGNESPADTNSSVSSVGNGGSEDGASSAAGTAASGAGGSDGDTSAASSGTSGATSSSGSGGGAGVLFQQLYDAGDFPACGWEDPQSPGATWSRTHVPGGGASGQNAIDIVQLPSPSSPSFGGQFNWGWRGHTEPQDPGYGARRVYRWRLRFDPATNFHALGWDDGEPAHLTNKHLIVGQGCEGEDCRFILTYRGDRDTHEVSFRIQKDGGVDEQETGAFPIGVWLDVQVELHASSSHGVADGAYRIWVNSNDYGTPAAERTGIVLNAVNWSYVWFGAFSNNGLAPEGTNAWRSADFEIGDTFDAGWHP